MRIVIIGGAGDTGDIRAVAMANGKMPSATSNQRVFADIAGDRRRPEPLMTGGDRCRRESGAISFYS